MLGLVRPTRVSPSRRITWHKLNHIHQCAHPPYPFHQCVWTLSFQPFLLHPTFCPPLSLLAHAISYLCALQDMDRAGRSALGAREQASRPAAGRQGRGRALPGTAGPQTMDRGAQLQGAGRSHGGGRFCFGLRLRSWPPLPRDCVQGPPHPEEMPPVRERPAVAQVSYGHPWAHYSGGYQDRLLGGPLGLLDLCYTTPDGVERKDHEGGVLG
jgi:hypothetical protein